MYTEDDINAYMESLPAKGYKPDDIAAYRKHLMENFGPLAPGGTPERAIPQDILTTKERIATSFGNEAGIKGLLESKGYKNIARTKSGELLAQDPEGKWVYEPTNFFPSDITRPIESAHPLKYLEASTGAAVPLAGMAVGALGAGIPGAGVGAFTGQGLRQRIGRQLGTYQGGPESEFREALPALGEGVVAETGGKALQYLPLKKYLPKYFADKTLGEALQTGTNYWLDKFKSAIARSSSLGTLGKVPVSSTARMIERPKQVMAATEHARVGEPSDVVQKIADEAEAELLARGGTLGQNVGAANAKFMEKFGKQSADTRPVIRQSEEFLNKIPLNEFGTGKMDPTEINAFKDFVNREFTTEKITTQPIGGELFSKPIKAPEITVPYTQVAIAPDFAKGLKVVPGEVVNQKLPGPVVGYSTRYPTKTFESLKPTADDLVEAFESYKNQNPLAKSLPLDIQYKRLLARRTKELFHNVDPNLAEADKAYSSFKDNAELLKALSSPGRGEGFISNIMGKNKTEAQNAAKQVIPQTYHGSIQDLRAARDFSERPRYPGSWSNVALAGRGLLTAAGGYGSYHAGASPADALAIAATIGTMTDPIAHKYGLYFGSRVSRPLGSVLRESGGTRILPWAIYEGE